jgi:hypothetical protein
MTKLRPGDMVRPTEDIAVYESWGNTVVKRARFTPDMVGVVLETNQGRGGNGCKVLLLGGKVGWCNLYCLEVLNEI